MFLVLDAFLVLDMLRLDFIHLLLVVALALALVLVVVPALVLVRLIPCA